MNRSLLPAATAAVLALVAASSALAGEFEPDGTFGFDASAAASIDFESPPPPSPDPSQPPPTVTASDTALDGSHVLSLGAYESQDFVVALPAEARAYRASLWLRGGEAVGYLGVSYGAGARLDMIATLYPTGRMTSDGWVELANDALRVDGTRTPTVSVGAFCTSSCELDAFELVPGTPLVAPVDPSCKGIGDSGVCGEGQVCTWGECRDVNGWVPPIPAERDAVTNYLENRLRFLFGPYFERAVDLPFALLAIEQMRHASDPWSYWNGFMLAVRRLHDGHTSTSGTADYALENPKPLSVCFVEGDADASHATAPSDPAHLDVLVSHVGSDHALGLARGDRLVRVDGQHPIAWARSLVEISWPFSQASNHETFAELASRLRSFISRYAETIEVIRCVEQGGVASCGPVETISIGALPLDPPGTTIDAISCDSRPLRHLGTSPPSHTGSDANAVYHGLVLEADPAERIYGVEWESLDTSSGNDGVGANLKAAVNELRTAPAAGAIFDHRTGFGGTIVGADIVWDFAVPHTQLTFFQSRQRAEDEQPTLAEGVALFAAGLSHGLVDYAGGATPSDIPVALLVTQDVSASDWLPLGLKQGPHTRIFGPYQTNGGFSTRFVLGYWFGMQYVLASGDTFTADGVSHNGKGVEPDELVLPRQSDLVRGIDTVFEAALAWIRAELP